jgi:hypothetical protein
VRLPVSVTEYYTSENSEGPKDRRRDRIRLGLEIAALIAAILAGVFTFRTLAQVRRQADAAQTQVGIMQKQLEATDRPWISVDITANTEYVRGAIVGGPLFFDQNGFGRMAAKIVMRNIGNSVASRVYIRELVLAIGLDATEMTRPSAEQKKLCAGPNRYARDPNIRDTIDPRFTIFPKDSQVEYENVGFPTKDILEIPTPRPFKNGKPVQVFLIACVDYEYALPQVPHQTGFIYEVFGDRSHHGVQNPYDDSCR